jgi:recombinational DNA repair protein RecR
MSDKSEFLEILRHNRNCVPVGDIRVKTRCVLCGDSKRDANKKRLYIVCDPNDPSDPVKYICFNCGEFGLLTPDMFSMITGSDNDEDIRLLKRINKMAFNSSGGVRVNKYKNNKEINVIIPPPRKTQNTIRKIRYMNERIGVQVPLEDYERLKLVFSIREFLQINNIPLLKKYQPFIETYERDYIGWLSVKNEYIILRDITGKNKFRYVKFNIFGMESNAHSFFTIKNGINTISQNPIRFVVTEGPFDILSVVYNIYGGIAEDCIFMSTNHGAFYNPLLYYINKGLVGSNIYIDIYRDSDSIMDYELLRNQLKLYTKNFSVYRNSIGKDFGVPKEKFIIEREM